MKDSLGITRLLEAVAKSDSLAGAAEHLGISGPTLTQRMQELEATLPRSPFAVVGRKKVLSAFGTQLLEATRPLAQALDAALVDAIANETRPEHATIRLCGRAEILGRFARSSNFPGTVVLLPCSSAEASQRLVDYECDFALSHLPPAHQSLVSRKLFSSGYVLCVPAHLLPDTPWGDKLPLAGDARWNCLRGIPCFSYAEDHPSLRLFLERSGLLRENLHVSIFSQNWEVVADLVARGKGFAVIPEGFCDNAPNVQRWPFGRGSHEKKHFAVHYRKETGRLPSGRAFLASLAAVFGRGE